MIFNRSLLSQLPATIVEKLPVEEAKLDDVGMSSASIYSFNEMILKVEALSEESSREHQLLKWLDGRIAVPKVIESVIEGGNNYLLMTRLEGEYACAPYWLENPNKLVIALAKALKMLWEIPIQDVPFDARLSEKLQAAEYNVTNGLCDMLDAEEGTYGEEGFSSPTELLACLKAHQPEEDLVFSHGDFCLPNIFLDQGEISGFIDLGRGGVADRYQDIALCYRSLKHNFDGRYNGGIPYPNFDPNSLFEALNITPDWEKIHYYILLDELF